MAELDGQCVSALADQAPARLLGSLGPNRDSKSKPPMSSFVAGFPLLLSALSISHFLSYSSYSLGLAAAFRLTAFYLTTHNFQLLLLSLFLSPFLSPLLSSLLLSLPCRFSCCRFLPFLPQLTTFNFFSRCFFLDADVSCKQ